MPERAADESLRPATARQHVGIETLVEDIGPAPYGVHCYARQREAIREVFPDHGDRWKCRLSLRHSSPPRA